MVAANLTQSARLDYCSDTAFRHLKSLNCQLLDVCKKVIFFVSENTTNMWSVVQLCTMYH